MKKKIPFIKLLLLVPLAILYSQKAKIKIATGYGAKYLCTAHFISERNIDTIENKDLNFSFLKFLSYKVDPEEMTVEASMLGFAKQKAKFSSNFGCYLYTKEDSAQTSSFNKNDLKITPFSFKDSISPKVQKLIESHFIDSNYSSPINSKALVVVKNGKIIAEKYALGINKNTILPAWSCSKSIVASLIGILENEGKLNLHDNHLFDEWNNDTRKNIKLDDLIKMQSGLEWSEVYDEVSDVTNMLYNSDTTYMIPLSKKLTSKTGSNWFYSSGTSNLLSHYIKNKFNTIEEYHSFPYKKLFYKIGMSSIQLETDKAGNYILSSYSNATARDWAKFALLHLNRGIWNNDTLFSPNYINYLNNPSIHSKGKFGGHFWINSPDKNGNKPYPFLPENILMCRGYQGQRFYIIPDENLVVIRLGITRNTKNAKIDELVGEIIKTSKYTTAF